MTDKRNQRRGGFYWVENVPYVTVTTVLKAINKPALQYWFGREIYLAMVRDPTLGQKEAMSAPYKKSDKAKKRGTDVHLIVENFKETGEKITGIPDDIKKYAEAFYSWIKDYKVTIVDTETTVTSKKYMYRGTADMRVKLNGDKGVMLIDVKTGKGIYDEVQLQLSAYKQAFEEEGQKIDRMGVLLLETGKDNKPTGNYKFETKTYDFDTFLAVKKLWEWQNKELCFKVDYKGGK